jgi:hypothetical protein
MKDVSFIAAYPKSGITFLNYMLFHALFDGPQHVQSIDSDYIFDLHESLHRVPPVGPAPRYVKAHFCFGPNLPLLHRAIRAVCLVRDPIDVMMSIWDFKHLTNDEGLLETSDAEHAARFDAFRRKWLATGGLEYNFAGSWLQNVRSWLAQTTIPALFVRYERLKEEPLAELQRVLKFLDRPVSIERIGAAVEAGKVGNMRQQEAVEVANGVSGAFYRPFLAKGYARGYRFVGRLHQGSRESVLSPAEQRQADEVFGPILAAMKRP